MKFQFTSCKMTISQPTKLNNCKDDPSILEKAYIIIHVRLLRIGKTIAWRFIKDTTFFLVVY